MCGIATFPCDEHYGVTVAMWAREVCVSTGCLMDKIAEIWQI